MAYRNYVSNDNLNIIEASLFKQGNTNLYFVLGAGLVSWDTGGLPSSFDFSTNQLYDEVYRVAIDPTLIEFVDPDLPTNISTTPTNMIRIEVNIKNIPYQGDIREYGLVGATATSTINTGILFEYCNFDKIQLPPDINWKKYFYLKIR